MHNCKYCNYSCDNKYNFRKHLETRKHLVNKGIWKSTSEFYCEKCDYTTKFRSNFKKHLLTEKHRGKKVSKRREFVCNSCGKVLYSRTTLWRHKRACGASNENITKILEAIMEKQTDAILKLAEKKTVTNITNKMTVNMYLNNECKSAMNLTEFVDNIVISLADLMKTRSSSYVGGLSSIFIKNLNGLPTKDRPLHCSDIKRLKFYVKEEDKWERDDGEKVENAINKVATKQLKSISEWEAANPGWITDEKKRVVWRQMVCNVMGPGEEVERKNKSKQIVKKIGENFILKNVLEL
jgi:hypothetical protein